MVVRLLVLLWAAPAMLMTVGGTRALFGSITPTALIGYLAVARAAMVVLAIFTLLVGAMWVVRTWDHIPGLSSLTMGCWGSLGRWTTHLRFLVIGVGCALVAPSLGSAAMVAWSGAAASAFVAGLLLPRWLTRSGHDGGVAFAWLAGLLGFELTVGWLIWSLAESLPAAVAGSAVAGFAMARGLALVVAVLASTFRLGVGIGAPADSRSVTTRSVEWSRSENSVTSG